jgi:hypothetical protein
VSDAEDVTFEVMKISVASRISWLSLAYQWVRRLAFSDSLDAHLQLCEGDAAVVYKERRNGPPG